MADAQSVVGGVEGGVSAGSAFGPYGMAAGGILGGVLSAFGPGPSQDAMWNQVGAQRVLRQTAYQDTVADMKKAGLNPIMAAGGGATSTPSVSQLPQTTSMSKASAVGGIMNSAASVAATVAGIQKTMQDTATSEANANNIDMNTAIQQQNFRINQVFQYAQAAADLRQKGMQSDQLDAQISKIAAETLGQYATNNILQNQAKASAGAAAEGQARAKYLGSATGSFLNQGAQGASDISKALTALQQGKDLINPLELFKGLVSKMSGSSAASKAGGN